MRYLWWLAGTTRNFNGGAARAEMRVAGRERRLWKVVGGILGEDFQRSTGYPAKSSRAALFLIRNRALSMG